MQWNSLNSFAHKFIGVRCAKAIGLFTDRMETNYGMVFPASSTSSSLSSSSLSISAGAATSGGVLSEIAAKRLVFVGEIHSVPSNIALQKAVLEKQCEKGRPVHVILEHFSFEMQHLLDDYRSGKISFDELVKAYENIGTEGHDIGQYQSLLQYARDHSDRVSLVAGFIPRTYARLLMREGPDIAISEAKAKQYVPHSLTCLEGSIGHYNMFESMITGRDMYDDNLQPTDQLRKIFQAQLIKDVSMAHRINTLIESQPSTDAFLVIAGKGHLLHFMGVPELVFEKHPELSKEAALLICQEADTSLEGITEEDLLRITESNYGPKGTNPADYIFFYESEEVRAKLETSTAYNKVGDTAHLRGDSRKAMWIMSRLGYSEEEIRIAGDDIYNYQGVGNPHRHAKIKGGERVLDVGSGLGIDSFIAHHYVGKEGLVVGIDLSKREVEHAQRRAKERGQSVQFINADMERLPFEDSEFDVIISNGAFCLAPNKRKAFQELFRVLKPGGRISVYTSTVEMGLEPGVNWPTCMRMFIQKDLLKPLCEEIGFTHVFIDESDSLMQFEIPMEFDERGDEPIDSNSEKRFKVHVGSEEFQHLAKYDMNKLCSRVCVVAEKPRENFDPAGV